MHDGYLTLTTSLVTGLIGVAGALGGVRLNNRHQSTQLRADLLRERGEELYSLVSEWLNGLFFSALRRCGVMRGEIDYNQCLAQDIEWGKGRTSAVPVDSRLQMLVDVYFPNTRSAYDDVISCRSVMNEIELTFRHVYDAGCGDGALFLPRYVAASKAVDQAGARLQRRILEEIRAIKSD